MNSMPVDRPGVHASHCCPVHGCKYGETTCPVATLQLATKYPLNNGCELCEHQRNIGNRFWGFNEEELRDLMAALSTSVNSPARTKLWNEAMDVWNHREGS